MITQSDNRIRAVNLSNLEAMCKRASGTCHRFHVSKVSRSRVHVEYSNPNEYGTEHPITAVFPCVPNEWDPQGENPYVLIGHMLRTIGGHDSEDWQYFEPITSGAPLYRDPVSNEWRSRRDIDGTDRYLCPDNVIRTVDHNHPYTNDTFAAFEVTNEKHPNDPMWERTQVKRHWTFYLWREVTPVKE